MAQDQSDPPVVFFLIGLDERQCEDDAHEVIHLDVEVERCIFDDLTGDAVITRVALFDHRTKRFDIILVEGKPDQCVIGVLRVFHKGLGIHLDLTVGNDQRIFVHDDGTDLVEHLQQI